MDFQTCKTKIIFNTNGHLDYSGAGLSKKIEKFISEITPGTMIVIKFPLIIERRSGYSGGVHSFSVEIVNLDTLKSLSMKATDLYSKLLKYLNEPEEIL